MMQGENNLGQDFTEMTFSKVWRGWTLLSWAEEPAQKNQNQKHVELNAFFGFAFFLPVSCLVIHPCGMSGNADLNLHFNLN